MRSTVEWAPLGPVGTFSIAVRFFDGLLVDAVALGENPQALLTMLYRLTDCPCRAAAPV